MSTEAFMFIGIILALGAGVPFILAETSDIKRTQAAILEELKKIRDLYT